MKIILTTIMGLFMLTQLTAQSPTTIPAKPEMVNLFGGTFSRGSNSGNKDESPMHSVTVNDFSIGIRCTPFFGQEFHENKIFFEG